VYRENLHTVNFLAGLGGCGIPEPNSCRTVSLRNSSTLYSSWTYFLERCVEDTYRKKSPLQGQLSLTCGSNNKPNGQFNQQAWVDVKRFHWFDADRC